MIIVKDCSREEFLLEILKEPFPSATERAISKIDESAPLKFHCSTLLHKILEVQRIVVENPSEIKNIRDIALEVALSLSYLSLKFKELTGISFKKFVQKIKLCNSLWKVISTDKSIKWISRKIGYTPEAFTRIFRSVFGLSPNKVRKRFHEHLKKYQEF